MGELPAQQGRVDVHRDGRGVGGGRRAPEPEVVRPAVGLRQAGPGTVTADRARFAVVPGQDRRLPTLRGGLFSGVLLTFAHSLGEFGATVLVSGNLRLRTQTAPLYIFAQFEAGNIADANAVAAVLAALSFIIFFFLLRYTGKRAS